jgi:hypothetical protein
MTRSYSLSSVHFLANFRDRDIYEYFGPMVLFYSNEHEPVHVHGKCEARECRAEILLVNGAVTGIRYTRVSGRNPLTPR